MPKAKAGIRAKDLKHAAVMLCRGCPKKKPGCMDTCNVQLVAYFPSGTTRFFRFMDKEMAVLEAVDRQ